MKHEQNHVALRSLLLRNCPRPMAEKAVASGSTRHYARGATIFTPHRKADDLFIVLSGWVKLYRVMAGGGEAIIDVLGPARSIGNTAALRAPRYLAHAEAVTDCTLLKIPAAALFELMDGCPEARGALMANTLHQVQRLVGQVEALKMCTGAQRAAQFILSLVPEGRRGACKVQLPYDKALIAGQVGLSPESLSRAFRRLREQGVRVQRREVTVDDVASLAAYAGVREVECA
ncbi:Crp/Fnr family transcriptional regulator [Vannielia litorea]|uniref:Crp/Fnr family transcriptional regulator n=1 Tax=Vannielia litorea TaxID=1217970 RepID=UPI001BCB5711|nr:Crp/Fnr family transcriptional regulator [Vannielia litorea]MBS8226456.1 Crp/Fnr family transcriptional regulator [Vannielia litorea]